MKRFHWSRQTPLLLVVARFRLEFWELSVSSEVLLSYSKTFSPHISVCYRVSIYLNLSQHLNSISLQVLGDGRSGKASQTGDSAGVLQGQARQLYLLQVQLKRKTLLSQHLVH